MILRVGTFLKNNILHSNTAHKKIPEFIIYYNNGKCFLVLVIYISLLCFFFFFKKQKIIDLKKSSWTKYCNINFLFLLKIGSVGPVDQQINLVSPNKRVISLRWKIIVPRFDILCLTCYNFLTFKNFDKNALPYYWKITWRTKKIKSTFR